MMAFHVACPITCRSICFCTLGFSEKLQSEKGRKGFLEEVFRVEEFLSDPFFTKAKDSSTVQVAVPHIEPPPSLPTPPPPPPVIVSADGFGGGGEDGYSNGGGEDVEELLSVQSKRVTMQRKPVFASLAAEDYARRFETRGLQDVAGENVRDLVGEDQSSSTAKVMCRICFRGEHEGSEKAIKMPSCKLCNKKYHRSCLKKWARNRDLFHWSSWVCPSCRSCEICRRTGDPTKFMFCKRCDGAFHCYCQHPPHKNVSHGPYLCPKHTRCHSCESNISGSGLSTRWFLGYTCCDACGRLFVKGKFCPVCLKVYRDSESTPMVCCDVCERWVHCQCDGIRLCICDTCTNETTWGCLLCSDEKYMQFQVDRNLYYKCAACRGECYQVKDLDDSIQELWRRRDIADRDQIVSLRAAAGLPFEEEIFSTSPYSDEENEPIVLKNDSGRFLKISVKGSVDKATKKTKEYVKKKNKKYEKKKGNQVPSICETEGHQSHDLLHDSRSLEFNLADEMKDDMLSYNSEHQDPFTSLGVRTLGDTKEKCSINQAGFMKHNFVEEAVSNTEDTAPRIVQFKRSKSHGLYHEDGTSKHASKSENVKGKKLVIHLGARNRNATNSPRSEAGHHRDQDLTASNGEELDNANELKDSKHNGREGNLIKLANTIEGSTGLRRTRVSSGRNEGSTNVIETVNEEAPALISDEVRLRRHSKSTPSLFNESQDNDINMTSGSDALPKDRKPLLKLKFKTPYINNQSSWAPQTEEERSFVKGQRSKRKKPSIPVREGEELTQMHQDNQINESVDANWILRKLGKDAIGKRVEVHQPSDSSWHKGVITDVVEGTSTLAVHLDDGRAQTLKLGKQGVRLIPQKQKRSKTLNMI